MMDTFWLADRTRLFVQYTISLSSSSSLCKLIWRHWTYKMPVRYILSSVWVRLSIFSPLSIIKHVGLYVFSLPISVVMIERMYILCLIIIIKSEVWTITHCLGLVMKQWCPLYVFLYSYEFVIWPDCFVGHSCPGGICPESGPLSLTCSITTMLGTLLTIDT